ncbi:hypothetical protein M1M34_gp093 [Haloarcula tailed virus 2]|uniref:Uncharacterized protein n=1 Tax=Haloarcula tailed virus 2 TaxID=2877989 RepID=A0AAE8XZX8_9CAUD|nr:hypothetical protein M1M34_gp093 [Haloarcula tailed virus 2]UBF23240.1 hypothetical protein HATV-2_gp89 [Haloarcula tailed virus 2]
MTAIFALGVTQNDSFITLYNMSNNMEERLQEICEATNYGEDMTAEWEGELIDLTQDLSWSTDHDGDDFTASAYIGDVKVQWGTSVTHDRNGARFSSFGYLVIEGYISDEESGDDEYVLFELDCEIPDWELEDELLDAEQRIEDWSRERRQQRQDYWRSVM